MALRHVRIPMALRHVRIPTALHNYQLFLRQLDYGIPRQRRDRARSQHQCRDSGSHREFRHLHPSLLPGLRSQRSLAQMVKSEKEIAIEEAALEAPNGRFYNDLFSGLRELEVFISNNRKLSKRMVDQDVTRNLAGIDRDVPEMMRKLGRENENGRVVKRLALCNYRASQVFVSYRELDTRDNLAQHVHGRLTSAGITTFLDSEVIEYGHSISTVIVDAIEHSDICVPIFSPDFASSAACLMEVAKMVELGKEIRPIFFFVKPCDVRHHQGTYEKSFAEHVRKGRFPKSTIQEWRKALTEIAGIRGLEFKNAALEAPNGPFYNNLFRGLQELEVFISNIRKLSKRMVDQDVTQNLVGINRDVPEMMRKFDCENGRRFERLALCDYRVFQVFLSFRGPDSRDNLAQYLYDRLTSAGIMTFLDSEVIEYGHSISTVIVDAIEQSDICVPIFSPDFASSAACLTEVAKMVELGKEIRPIFFFIKPCDVRDQLGTYEKSFAEHMCNKHYPDSTIQEWRKALTKIAGIGGPEFK